MIEVAAADSCNALHLSVGLYMSIYMYMQWIFGCTLLVNCSEVSVDTDYLYFPTDGSCLNNITATTLMLSCDYRKQMLHSAVESS